MLVPRDKIFKNIFRFNYLIAIERSHSKAEDIPAIHLAVSVNCIAQKLNIISNPDAKRSSSMVMDERESLNVTSSHLRNLYRRPALWHLGRD